MQWRSGSRAFVLTVPQSSAPERFEPLARPRIRNEAENLDRQTPGNLTEIARCTWHLP